MDSALVVGGAQAKQRARQSSVEASQRRPFKAIEYQAKPRIAAQDVESAAKKEWAASGYALSRTLDCHFQGGVLLLRGSVSSFYYKQIAQESVRAIAGVERIVNTVVVLDVSVQRGEVSRTN